MANDVYPALEPPYGVNNHTKLRTNVAGELLTEGTTVDNDPTSGDTLVFAASTTDALAFSLPAVAGGVITSIIVDVKADQLGTNMFSISFNGVDFWELETGEHLAWTPRGSKAQLTFKGNAVGVEYKIILNRNDP